MTTFLAVIMMIKSSIMIMMNGRTKTTTTTMISTNTTMMTIIRIGDISMSWHSACSFLSHAILVGPVSRFHQCIGPPPGWDTSPSQVYCYMQGERVRESCDNVNQHSVKPSIFYMHITTFIKASVYV